LVRGQRRSERVDKHPESVEAIGGLSRGLAQLGEYGVNMSNQISKTNAKSLKWRSVETAPNFPTEDYLAIDANGYIHVTRHDRATLMHAGWADGWHPMKGEPTPDDGLNPRDGGMEIAAMHAREFKRLLTQHRMPADTVIEGVRLA
jgi:hypothetical protein